MVMRSAVVAAGLLKDGSIPLVSLTEKMMVQPHSLE